MKPSIILKNHENLKTGKTTVDFLISECNKKMQQCKDTNSVITECCDAPKDFKLTDNLLSGCIYSLKDNISTKGIRTTGASKFLDDYIPPYNATIYELLKSSGAILTSKNNLDQFGMAGTGIQTAYGYAKNILDKSRITGGSSSGSVNLVAGGIVDFAIGTDTGDSVRRPSSFLGVVGYKPSYGLISRYGVLPYAPSLDHVGIITRTVADAAIVADQVCQFDPKDYTSQKLEHNFYKNLKVLKGMKISVIKGIEDGILLNERKIYLNVISKLKENGHTIVEKEVDIKLLNGIGVTYQIISNVEGLSCYASFTGVPFGANEGGQEYKDLIFKNRNKYINNQVKKRMLMGAYVTSRDNFKSIYIKAKKVRTLLIELMNKLMDNVDGLLIPSASFVAPTLEDTFADTVKTSHADDCLILANFAGTPSITIPAGNYNGLPYGININCKQKQDQTMFDIAATIETILEDKNE